MLVRTEGELVACERVAPDLFSDPRVGLQCSFLKMCIAKGMPCNK